MTKRFAWVAPSMPTTFRSSIRFNEINKKQRRCQCKFSYELGFLQLSQPNSTQNEVILTQLERRPQKKMEDDLKIK